MATERIEPHDAVSVDWQCAAAACCSTRERQAGAYYATDAASDTEHVLLVPISILQLAGSCWPASVWQRSVAFWRLDCLIF
jgi:hypothetical protein